MIMQCVSTFSFSILVNVVLQNTFRPLRQGCSLSSNLIIPCAKGFECIDTCCWATKLVDWSSYWVLLKKWWIWAIYFFCWQLSFSFSSKYGWMGKTEHNILRVHEEASGQQLYKDKFLLVELCEKNFISLDKFCCLYWKYKFVLIRFILSFCLVWDKIAHLSYSG